MAIDIRRKPLKLLPDPSRVITRFYMPGQKDRAELIIKKVMALSDQEVEEIFNQILRNFSKRHRNITKIFQKNFNKLAPVLDELKIDPATVPLKKALFIGSYFTMEYSIESAAFFNPSIVEHPDQSDIEVGRKRVIVSFRGTGEGHISSIVFRSGILNGDQSISFTPPGKIVEVPEVIKRYVYEKDRFLKKLNEMKIQKDVIGMVLDRLGDSFLYGELLKAIEDTIKTVKMSHSKQKVIEAIKWLASSHYEVTFSYDTDISDRVIFPVSYTETNGIEDARFVRFVDDDGEVTYYATYTAYDGFSILPKLLETKDFYYFKVSPLHGRFAQNKGMSLFPRRINGKYVMVARSDGYNNYILFSDNINIWDKGEKFIEPRYPWEYVQIGNAGSPLETEKGWLLLIHGVGPVRRYSLGAVLLDKDNPQKIIGRMKEPLLIPNEDEREGYVPNVVYSCGSIIHKNELIIAYGYSDYASSFAGVMLDELFRHFDYR